MRQHGHGNFATTWFLNVRILRVFFMCGSLTLERLLNHWRLARNPSSLFFLPPTHPRNECEYTAVEEKMNVNIPLLNRK